ncbi:MAG: hypothetical protein LBI69_05140 [Puniceicoccales bacterium]|nr:hypothetical protein [Puniceicoccales bacterium]
MSITTFEKEPQSERTTKLVYAYSPEEAMRILQTGTVEEFLEFLNDMKTDVGLLKSLLTSFTNLNESTKTIVSKKIAHHIVWDLDLECSLGMFICGLLTNREFDLYAPSVYLLGCELTDEGTLRIAVTQAQKEQEIQEMYAEMERNYARQEAEEREANGGKEISLEEAQKERDAAQKGLEEEKKKRDAAQKERDAAQKGLEEAKKKRDAAQKEREEAQRMQEEGRRRRESLPPTLSEKLKDFFFHFFRKSPGGSE